MRVYYIRGNSSHLYLNGEDAGQKPGTHISVGNNGVVSRKRISELMKEQTLGNKLIGIESFRYTPEITVICLLFKDHAERYPFKTTKEEGEELCKALSEYAKSAKKEKQSIDITVLLDAIVVLRNISTERKISKMCAPNVISLAKEILSNTAVGFGKNNAASLVKIE